MEYIIYCDESVSDGKFYTDFFGGVLVRNTDYDVIKAAIDAKKAELNHCKRTAILSHFGTY